MSNNIIGGSKVDYTKTLLKYSSNIPKWAFFLVVPVFISRFILVRILGEGVKSLLPALILLIIYGVIMFSLQKKTMEKMRVEKPEVYSYFYGDEKPSLIMFQKFSTTNPGNLLVALFEMSTGRELLGTIFRFIWLLGWMIAIGILVIIFYNLAQLFIAV